MLSLVHDALHVRWSGFRPGRLALLVVVGLLSIYGSLTSALPRLVAEALGMEPPALFASATASEERSEHETRVEGPEKATLCDHDLPTVAVRTLTYGHAAPQAFEEAVLLPPTPPPLVG